MNAKDNLKELISVMEELRSYPVIVEGRKDATALARFGVTCVQLNGRPLETVAADLHGGRVKEIVILTDYDREGKQIFLKLKKLLQKYRIKHNARLRGKVMEFGKTRIEDFNGVGSSLDYSLSSGRLGLCSSLGLASPLKGKRGDRYVKTGSYFHKVPDKGPAESEGYSGKKRCYRCHIRPD